MSERRTGPRPAVLGTCTLGPWSLGDPAERLAVSLEMIDAMAREAARQQWPLDLAVLPEHITQGGNVPLAEKAEPLDGRTITALAAKARQHGCNVAASVLLADQGRVTNSVVFLDRAGRPVGRYDKLHPVLHLDGTLECGVSPGAGTVAVDLDIGRVGAQVCFDVFYDEGWQALDECGAELVVLPSASSSAGAMRSHAWRHEYYVLSSTFRVPTLLVDPLGREVARTRADREVLVARVDLDYRVLPWNSLRDFGKALGEKYGPRLCQNWDYEQDLCLLTSLDGSLPVGELMRREGLETHREHLARNTACYPSAKRRP
ncbi:MAG TPA: carbon-nitrogen hydrolase family protein [Phycisphaerae bacterium]|nr:carbon-nitrogen hydrolase family protein [Phycisphaerae bacterium]